MKVKDNGGHINILLDGLKDGDWVECIQEMRGFCDGGSPYHLFKGVLLEKGKKYRVVIRDWGFQKIPTIVDEDSCTQWVKETLFIKVNENENK